MIKRALSLSMILSMALLAQFKSIDAKTVLTMQKEGVPVIDIRTPQEWRQRGIIKGAHLIMFFDRQGHPHTREWLEKFSQLVKSKKTPVILYCAHANRSKAVGRWLSDKMGYQKVYELQGGIEYGWRDKGMPIERIEN